MAEIDQIKIAELDRKALSSDLAYDDYFVFNDNDAGIEATKAVTMFAIDSYAKAGVHQIARTAVSAATNAALPRIEVITISGTNTRTERLDAHIISAIEPESKLTVTDAVINVGLSAVSLSGTTVSANTVSAANIYGTVRTPLNINTPASNTSYLDSLHVDGDLHVHGNTITTSAINLSVHDPIIELAKDQTGPGVDFGVLGNRGGTNNGIIFFDESANEWAVAFTNDDATTSGNITVASYSNFQANDVTFNAATIADGSGIEALNATKLTAGSIPNARVSASNVTQHEAALTIATSQVTELTNYARVAVSSENLNLSGLMIRATDRIDTKTSVSGLTVSGTLDAKYIDTQYLTELNSNTVADADTTFVKDATDSAQKRVTLANLKTYFSLDADVIDEARTAVSATDMYFLHAASITGADIRGDGVSGSTVSGTNLYGKNVYINGTAEANNLDNYVEGSWTPSFTFGGGSTTYTTQDGYYTRIGNLIYCTFKLEIGSLSTPTGTLTLAGLPVAASNNTGGAGVGGVVSTSINYETNATEVPNSTELSIKTNKNTQTANLVFSNDGVAPFTATPAMLNNGSVLEASFFYQA